jgi:hypothetical protein
MVSHPVAGRPIASITTGGGTYLTDPNKRSLIDYRVGELAVYSSALASHSLIVDMGSNFTLTQLIVPTGHNLIGATCVVQTDDNVGFATPTLVGSITPANFLVIDLPLTTAVAERYYRLSMGFGSATAPQLGEFWLGVKLQLGASSYVDPEFENGYLAQSARIEYPSGIVAVEKAVARRKFTLKVLNLDMGSTDYGTLSSVLRLGFSRPFWYWPPDDVAFQDQGPFFVILDEDGTRIQEFKSPTTSPRYSVQLAMVEQNL